jgi:hypothetical protein
MKPVQWLAMLFVGLVTVALATSRGTAPPPSADKYAAHAENDGAVIGITRLRAPQLRKAFAVDKVTSSDLEESCFVVEVGLYPAKNRTVEVSLAGFALHVQGEDASVKPSNAGAVVAKLPYRVQVGQNGGTGPVIGPRPSMDPGTGGIYRDPVTGMPTRRGAHTPKGTDGGTGAGESPSPQTSASGVWRDLEMQMTEKALPEGSTGSPVAGYIYFPVETKKDARYQLEYTLNGKRVVLPL